MLGMSNAIYEEGKMINGNQNHTEQEHKKGLNKSNSLYSRTYK